jgi:hypothetical protein
VSGSGAGKPRGFGIVKRSIKEFSGDDMLIVRIAHDERGVDGLCELPVELDVKRGVKN